MGAGERAGSGRRDPEPADTFKATFSNDHVLPSQASLVVSVGRDAALAGYGEA